MMHTHVDLEAASTELYLEQFPTQAYEHFYSQGWTDGLPIIPATVENVQRFVDASGRASNELIGVLPPRNGRVTTELIAVNAIMAGCLPEYMPMLIAAVEALADPAFSVQDMQLTTKSAAPFLLVNGPVRLTRGGRNTRFVHCQAGCLGPGWRSNATIGRAVNLILCNGGGSLSGVYTKSSFGSPLRYSYICAENQEANPWSPFHVDRGFAREQSTVTVFYAANYCAIPGSESDGPGDVLRRIATSMTPLLDTESALVLLGPTHTRMLHEAGFSKRQIQERLWELSRFPTTYFSEQFVKTARAVGRADSNMVLRCKSPDDIHVVVAGGPGFEDAYIAVKTPQTRIIWEEGESPNDMPHRIS